MPETTKEKSGPGLLIGLLNAKKSDEKDDFKVHTTGDDPQVTAAQGMIDAIKQNSASDLADALRTFFDVSEE